MIIEDTMNHTHCCSLRQNDFCRHHEPHTLLLSRAEWLLNIMNNTHCCSLGQNDCFRHHALNHTHCCSLGQNVYWKTWTTHTAALQGRMIIVETMNHTYCCSLGQNDYWRHHEPHTLLLSRAKWLCRNQEPRTLLLSRARMIIEETINHTYCCSLGQNDYWGHHEPHTRLLSRAEWLL